MSCKIEYKDGKIVRVNAPNGNESKLFNDILKLPQVQGDPEIALSLYAQVYTPTFKTWFGDWESAADDSSKVVDENGEPLLVYHGTNYEFNTFDIDKTNPNRRAFFFAGELEGTSSGAIIMPVFLNIKLWNDAREKGAIDVIDNKYIDAVKKINGNGIIGNGFYDETQIIVFEPNQIKSVFNRGGFLANLSDVTLGQEYGVDRGRPRFKVYYKGQDVGVVITQIEGEYLTIDVSDIEMPGQNIGTYAYMQIAEWAKEKGLTLRSDNRVAMLSETKARMSPRAHSLWKRFVDAGVAKVEGEHYIFTGNPADAVNNIYFSGDPSLQSSRASTITMDKVKSFLSAIGLSPESIKIVDQVVHEGKPLSAHAMVDAIKKSIQIVEGKENVTLPEEAMHLLVTLIKINRPKLYEALTNNVRDFKIYKELVNSPFYSNNKEYRKENGTLDLQKIKEEAVAKILAEYLIDGLEGVNEKPELMMRATNWWKQVLDWIMNFFGRLNDPFSQVIDDIIANNFEAYGDVTDINGRNHNGVFFSGTVPSLEERHAQFTGNLSQFNAIKNRVRDLNITKVNEKYYKNGEVGKRRVSDLVEDYYSDLFRNKAIPEDMKPFYDQTRQDGTYIHEILQDILNRMIDPDTGLLRDTFAPSNLDLSSHPLKSVYDYLAKNMVSRLSNYKAGTRFLVEQIIYDTERDMFGTVDFIAIDPDTGALDILDWKSIYFEEFTKSAGVREYKEEAFNIQIKQYKLILQQSYGIENFRQLRAIPIKKLYSNLKDDNGVPTGIRRLRGIQIGAANAADVTDESLQPVIIKEETTGNKKLDNFINILEKVKEDLKKRKTGKFDAGLYELVKKSIYELRTSQNITHLYQHSIIELKNILSLLDNIERDKAGYTNENINDVLGELNYYYNLVEALEKSSFLLREDLLKDEDVAKLNKLNGQFEKAKDRISEARSELSDKIAKGFNLFNLLKPEKVMHFWGKYMRNMSQAQTTSVQLLYKMVAKVYNRVDLKSKQDEEKLISVRDGVAEWAKRNNTDMKKALKHLLKMNDKGEWNGNMISTIDSEFYKQRSAIIKTGEKNAMLKWWNENYNLEEYTKWYQLEIEKYKAEIINAKYSEDPTADLNTKKFLIRKFEERYNIALYPSTALGPHNKEAWSKNIKLDKWHSTAYKFLLKPENKELLDAYNHFTAINKELVESGVIEARREHTFVPNVRKGFAETLAFEDSGLLTKTGKGIKGWFHDQYESIKVSDQQVNYSGYINPLTGERENRLFALYTSEIGEWVKGPDGESRLSYENKSEDLFTVYSLMNRQKHRYNYLKDVENVAQALRHIEEEKGSIQTSRFGRVQLDKQGNIKTSEDNSENLEILEKHIRAIVYGEIIQKDADMYISVSWNKFANAWNKSAFGKIKKLKEVDNEKPSGVSASKILMKLNSFNTKRVLGLSIPAAISNLFGGTASTFLASKRMFTDADLAEAATQMISGQWYATDDMQKRAALMDYFLPLLDNRPEFKAHQLSVSQTVRILSEDWIMAPIRKSEHIVQANIFLATIANTMVEDGKLVNIREYVQDKNGWSARFKISTQERKALEEKIEKEITQLKKDRSLTKIATFKTVKQSGKDVKVVDIPGIDRNSLTVEEFRQSIHNLSNMVLGSSTEFDLAAYKYNMWARLFMTFKNWMPRQLDVRFGEFRGVPTHDTYEWGRARMFWRALGANWFQSFLKLVPYAGRIASKKEDKTYLIDKAIKLYKEKIAQYRSLGLYNEESFIKEDEFIQMFLQGVDAQYTEFRNITIFFVIFMSAIFAPADDDDDETKAVKKKILKQIDKLSDELSFFYNPSSFIDVIGSKPLPVIGLMGDMYKLMQQTSKEWFGATFNIADGEWVEDAKPMKYLFKAFPVTKELLNYIPIIDPELAKEMDIKLQSTNRK